MVYEDLTRGRKEKDVGQRMADRGERKEEVGFDGQGRKLVYEDLIRGRKEEVGCDGEGRKQQAEEAASWSTGILYMYKMQEG